MKRLLILRHAKSSRDDPRRSDHDRPLAPQGIWAAEAVARHSLKRLRRVDFALCSSAIRARETLRIFEQHLPPACKTKIDENLYLANRGALRKALRRLDDHHEAVLLVGHEPGLSELAAELCAKQGSGKAPRRISKGFKTASLAAIDLDIERWIDLGRGTGKLRAMTRPKDLR